MKLKGWEKGKGAPLLSAHQLAAEVGLPVKVIAARIAKRDGPPMIRKTLCHFGRKEHCRYYEAIALRKWWVEIGSAPAKE